MFQKTITYFSIVIIVIGFIFLANGLILATPPTQDPPGGNVPAPLNVGTVGQTKSGTLTMGDVFSAGGKNLVIGDDTFLTDIDVANMLGIYGNQNSDRAGIRLGSDGAYIWGDDGDISTGGNLSVGGSIYGWNVPSDVKETSAIHNGNFGGYKAMYDWIQSNGCSGYHVCDATELTRYFQRSTAQFFGWYNSGVFISASKTQDCHGWFNSSNEQRGSYWDQHWPHQACCNARKYVLCCK